LSNLVARGLVFERPSEGPTYGLEPEGRDSAVSAAELAGKIIAEADLRNIANAVAELARLYPGVPPGEALARWLEFYSSGETVMHIANGAAALSRRYPHLEPDEALNKWLEERRRKMS
jgi:hypothetical protein